MTSDGFVRPVHTEESAPFWEGLAVGELRVQHCPSCGTPRFPPRPMCRRCRAVGADWRPVSPTGSLWSFVVAHPPVLPAFADQAPFNVVVVQLDADPAIRMVGNVVDDDAELVPGEKLAVGDAVELAIVRVAANVLLPRWRLR